MNLAFPLVGFDMLKLLFYSLILFVGLSVPLDQASTIIFNKPLKGWEKN